MMPDYCLSPLAQQFEATDIDPKSFGHLQHVQVAFELLTKYGFVDAASRYANSIRTISIDAGAPEKFNTTITYAFLSLIAERLATAPAGDCDTFVARNPDLLSKSVLKRWYSDERLQSDLARQVFLLPGNDNAAA